MCDGGLKFRTTNNMQMSINAAWMVLILQSVVVQILERQHIYEICPGFYYNFSKISMLLAVNLDVNIDLDVQRMWCILYMQKNKEEG